MRQIMKAVCMTLIVLSLFACGRQQGEAGNSAPPEETGDSMAVSGESVSGAALAKKQMDLTDSEAFAAAEDLLQDMTLEEKVRQMFLVDLADLDSAAGSGKNMYRMTASVEKALKEQPPGGIYLSEKNIKTEQQARRLIQNIQGSVSGSPLYIAVEEEGGGEHSLSAQIEDLKIAGYKMARDVGAMPEEQIRQTAGRIAEELNSWGINLNLAPVADISSEENRSYVRRCFGADSDHVSTAVKAYVEGMREYGLVTTLKYFPGIGTASPAKDAEKEIPQNNKSLMTLRNENFAPYTAGIKAGTDCIMVGNVALPKLTEQEKLPAFLSRDIVTSLLREELKFDGVIMTSSLSEAYIIKNYKPDEVAVEAVKSGCDMLVFPSEYETAYRGVLAAVYAGEIDEKAVNTAVRRILQDKIQRGIYILPE